MHLPHEQVAAVRQEHDVGEDVVFRPPEWGQPHTQTAIAVPRIDQIEHPAELGDAPIHEADRERLAVG